MASAIIYVSVLLGAISAIISTVFALVKFVAKPLIHYINESKETNKVLTKGLTACLHGLHDDLKCNGPVTEAMNEMEQYLITKAYK